MKPSDFKIGMEFEMSGQRWLCTDIGTRTIAAICLADIPKDDPSWLNGPPYAVPEQVIDENDLPACSADGFEAEGFDLSNAKPNRFI